MHHLVGMLTVGMLMVGCWWWDAGGGDADGEDFDGEQGFARGGGHRVEGKSQYFTLSFALHLKL